MIRGFVESYVVLLLLQENKPVGFSVLQLAVTDRDSSHNGPPFFFSIVSGNKEGAFEVNQQGALLTAAAINRKVNDHYLLHIKVLKSVFMILLWTHMEKSCFGGYLVLCKQLTLHEKTKLN